MCLLPSCTCLSAVFECAVCYLDVPVCLQSLSMLSAALMCLYVEFGCDVCSLVCLCVKFKCAVCSLMCLYVEFECAVCCLSVCVDNQEDMCIAVCDGSDTSGVLGKYC